MKNFIKSIIVAFLVIIINLTFGYATGYPNEPVLVGGLTPVKNGVETTADSDDWYDYSKNSWAHAKLTTIAGVTLQYVWIPRFTYKIDGEDVSIKWSNGTEDDHSDDFLSHPAFVFDNIDVEGFWMEESARNMSSNIVTEFSNALEHNIYGLSDSAAYTHITKASEWGAMVYLTKATENTTDIKVSGKEYVMGIKSKGVDSIFTKEESKKYIDLLNVDNLNSYKGYALKEFGEFGEAGDSDAKYLLRNVLTNWEFNSGNSGEKYRTSIYILSSEIGSPISFFDTEATVEAGSELLIGVDFNVDVDWKFPDCAIDEYGLNFFSEIEDLDNDRVIDLSIIYTGIDTLKQDELNAQIVSLITPDLEELTIEDIKNSTGFDKGKYTLKLNIGGTKNKKSIFRKYKDYPDSKIVVNEINLCKQDDDKSIKIVNVLRNKITLNIVGPVTTGYEVKMTKAPTQREYLVGDSLDYSGAEFVMVSNGVEVGEIDGIPNNLTYVEEPTAIAREDYKVRIKVNGKEIEQEEEFRINVYGGITVKAVGVKKDSSPVEELYTISGSKNYTKKVGDEIKLNAKNFHDGYMFYSWGDSDIIIADVSNREYTFEIDNDLDDEINFTADYVSPNNITGNNLKTEFIVGEDFSFGDGTFTANYTNFGGNNVSKVIDNTELNPSIVNKLNADEEIDKNNPLLNGEYTVTIEYGGTKYSYDIAVVNQKYDLTMKINEITCGSIGGDINSKAVSLTTENTLKQGVSLGNIVNLTATPKTGYSFIGWSINSDSKLILNEGELVVTEEEMPTWLSTSPTLSFSMPNKSIEITANFGAVLTFEIKEGQESFGELIGELTQNVVYGGKSSKVEAILGNDYVLDNWMNDETKDIVSLNDELIIDPVTKNAKYIATLAKRINIEEDHSDDDGIKAHIIGTKIKDGTLQYIITETSTVPTGTYTLNEMLGVANGTWTKDDALGALKSASVNEGYDSSTVITVNTSNEVENVKFDYIIDSSDTSQLGITINGERVVGPYQDITYGKWQTFEQEVESDDGKIVIGISYSQGDINDGNNYAAIKNLVIEKSWITIPNEYDLSVPMEYDINYIHVRGVGSDDDITYRAVSSNFGTEIPTLVSGSSFKSKVGTSVTSITFGDKDDYTSQFTWGNGTDLSEKNDKSIQLFNNGTDAYVLSESGRFVANSDCSNMFAYMESLNEICNLDKVDTSKVNNMSSMFYRCNSLTTLDVSSFNTSNVISMSFMFASCYNLTSLDLSNFNTSNVTNMCCLFSSCENLISVDVSSFDTSKVTNMRCMFYRCYKLESLELSSFDTSKVTTMEDMFNECKSLTSLNVSNFDTSKVTSMEDMFYGCSGLIDINLSNFDTINVTTMKYMFYCCSSLTDIDLSSFDTSKVTTMEDMFYGCNGLVSVDMSSFNTINVIDTSWLFFGCTNLKTIYASEDFVVDQVTDSTYMFWNCSNLIGGNGTKFTPYYSGTTYARIDTADTKGYFTSK